MQGVVVEGGRQVAGDRAGDDNLFGFRGQGGQAGAAGGVEFGEDVVEDKDRGVAVVAEQLEGAQARAAARAAAYGHANGVPAPASSTDEDPEGDLAALRQALEATGAAWSRSPGMAAMRPRYRRANSLGAILARTIKAREWDTPTKMGSIIASWSAIVGPQVAEHARIETFEGHKLVVRTDSTAWAKQLQLLLPTIERRIAEEVGSGVVEQLVILGPVAPSWKKGPYVVRGRGPRADYG